VWPSISQASPITVELLDAHYTTTVKTTFVGTLSNPDYSRITGSATPISDALHWTVFDSSDIFTVYQSAGAAAAANTFGVDASSNTGDLFLEQRLRYALASATTTLTFTPLADGLAPLVIDLITGSTSSFWSEGSITLDNLTTGEQLWTYGWDSNGSGGIWRPHTFGYDLLSSPLYADGPLSAETALRSSEQYRLSMYTQTQAAGDRQLISLQVSGFHTVPEPASITLLGIGCAVVVAAQRRRRRVVAPSAVHPQPTA
jgi:hypothetical protein